MKFGVMQGVLGESSLEVFAAAKALGFDGVEMDWHDPAQVELDGDLSPDRCPAIYSAALHAGVEIHSVAAHFLNRGGIASPDKNVREAGVEAVQAGILLCQDLCATALLIPFFGAAEIESDEDVVRVCESLKELALAAHAAEVTLAIEHTLPGPEASALLDRIDSPWVGDYWDMANCMSLGYDPVAEVRALNRHLVRVHAKEFDGKDIPAGPRAPRSYPGLNTCAFGEGQVPVHGVLAALREVGYHGYITLETGAFGDKKASAKAALEVLRAG